MYDKRYDVVLPQPQVWKPVKYYEGLYEVSNYGVVRGLDRVRTWYSAYHKGEVSRVFKGKVMSCKLKSSGYLEVHLRDEERHNYWNVHKLVSEAFHEDLSLPVVDHKNDCKTCNLLWNLQRCTVQFNTKKATDSGKNIAGNKGYTRKIPEEMKNLIRKLLSEGLSIRKIERGTGVSQRSIARIRDDII